MIRSSIGNRLAEAVITLIGIVLLVSFFSLLRRNTIDANSPPGEFFLEAGGNVVMEAEHFTGSTAGSGNAAAHNWQTTTTYPGYAGESAVQALPNNGVGTQLNTNGPALQYDMYIQNPGTYYVYVRGRAALLPSPGDNDSVHAGLDGAAVTTNTGSGLDEFGPLAFTWRNHANNGEDTAVTIAAPGFYTFYLWMREDGVVVDRIWLSLAQDVVINGSILPGPDESQITEVLPTPTPTGTPPTQGMFQEQDGNVVMEAEHFTGSIAGSGAAEFHTWEVTTELSGYTGDAALQALPNDGVDTGSEINGPALVYDIAFQTPGTYYVHVRGRAVVPRLQNDAIHVGLNGLAVTNLMGNGLNSFSTPLFTWRSRSNIDEDTAVNVPAPGIYTFYLWMKEDGTLVDKIWLSTTQDVIFNGSAAVGPDESPFIPPTPTGTETPTGTSTSTPTGTPTDTPTGTPASTSTSTPMPTVTGTIVPSVTPSPTATDAPPTDTPTPVPIRNWQQATTAASPPAVSEHALAYDQLRQRVVLYGGNESGWPYENSTWEFDGLDWSQVNTAQTPTAVYGMALVYDPVQQVSVLFGGSDPDDAVLDQTWQYDGTNWTQLFPAAAPPARAGHAMIYDAGGGRILLFGGDSETTAYNDTWAFDGTTWTLVNTATPPPARANHALAYIPGENSLLLFGGRDADGNLLADTWVLDLNTNVWSQIAAAGPTARQGHALLYDPLTLNSVLVGGLQGDDTFLNDTWHYQTGAGWTAAAPVDAPVAGAFYTAVYDTTNQRLVLLSSGETWLYE